jgi:hypothetical protein
MAQHTYEVKLAALRPASRGRMGQPRTTTATYIVTVEADNDALAMGLASVEAHRLETETYAYGDSTEFPYTVNLRETETERR